MNTKAAKADALLLQIDNLLGDIFDLQAALKQLGQYGVISLLSDLASQLSKFRNDRGKEDVRRLKEDERMQKLIRDAQAAIKRADAMIKELELKELKGHGQKPAKAKTTKKKTAAKVNLGQSLTDIATHPVIEDDRTFGNTI